MENEFKTVTSKEELESLVANGSLKEVWNNVMVGKKRYIVVKIDGYCHSEGGHWGTYNSYWCYPYNRKPSINNIMPFRGHVCCWGIITKERNRIKSKWYGNSVEQAWLTYITLNGKKLMPIPGRTEYALHKAMTLIVDLQENCPIDFTVANYREVIKGRKVYYRDQLATVVSLNEDLNVTLEACGGELFKPGRWEDEDGECSKLITTNVMDKDIWWYVKESDE